MNNLNYLGSHYGHVLKRRYSLDELKTMLSHLRLNNDDSLSLNEYNSYDKLNVREQKLDEIDAAIRDDNSMVAPTDEIPGLDPPTSSTASNSIEQFPANVKLIETKELLNDDQRTSTIRKNQYFNTAVSSHDVPGIDPPTERVASIERLTEHASIREDPIISSNQGQSALDLHYHRGPSSQNDLSSVTRVQDSSKKKMPPELPKDYPLFESPYPSPLVDGHLCR